MNPIIKEAVVASFVADALALGVHWVYDTAQIEKKYNRIQTMVTPELVPYHAPKQKGEFTHYGDQMMVLLESVTTQKKFALDHFKGMWQKMMSDYTGYKDQATRDTLANMDRGQTSDPAGSMSFDLGGAARMAPLALYYGENVERFVAAAVSQTRMTHNQRPGIEAAEFFARLSCQVLTGTPPVAAIEKTMAAMPDAVNIAPLVKAGLESRSKDTRTVIGQFGQMCSIQVAFPSAVHLIAKYPEDLQTALIENTMAGGDSSARGMLAGFILGCHQGLGNIPGHWLADMKAHEKILKLMG